MCFFCVFWALSFYPFGVKEGPILHFLEYVPFGRFSLGMYPLDHFFLKASILRALNRALGTFWPQLARQFCRFRKMIRSPKLLKN